ncbi:type VI secretion system tube protein Hcp [bacterium]|nr:type VI secretion system tube protein Hcp [bacterium]
MSEPAAEAEEFIKLGDIKGDATDNDHKDRVFVQVMMYCDLVDMGFTAEQADQIVELTLK